MRIEPANEKYGRMRQQETGWKRREEKFAIVTMLKSERHGDSNTNSAGDAVQARENSHVVRQTKTRVNAMEDGRSRLPWTPKSRTKL